MIKDFVRVENLRKSYGPVAAVSDLSVAIDKGESLTLLGPSGCGKTTTLRMIAGLETPDGGAIHFGGVPVVSVAERICVPTERRKIGMVFQSYAIWPHMTVGENVGFPLKVRRISAGEIRERVAKALAMVGLPGLEDRPAPRLSGGQQQRVALARALVHEPEVLLLDEPLSNLDVKLREQMCVELKQLQERLRLTLIYVTHDQTEALSLSDRIVLLNRGRVEQIGAPRDLYERPATEFVRDFLGKSVTLAGHVHGIADGRVAVALASAPDSVIECPTPGHLRLAVGDAVDVSVRPEVVRVGDCDGDPHNALTGSIEAILYQGERSECEVRLGGDRILVYIPPGIAVARGQAIRLTIPPDAASVWPKGAAAPALA
jgi:ABC-type Fe3+/spermidine/putrescine transport system ATPase subunit